VTRKLALTFGTAAMMMAALPAGADPSAAPAADARLAAVGTPDRIPDQLDAGQREG
jgi:hypothetical protein